MAGVGFTSWFSSQLPPHIHTPVPQPHLEELARLRLDALCSVHEHDGVVGSGQRAVAAGPHVS
eukprot:365036-Chlamydomonas_euryale.AAC.5